MRATEGLDLMGHSATLLYSSPHGEPLQVDVTVGAIECASGAVVALQILPGASLTAAA